MIIRNKIVIFFVQVKLFGTSFHSTATIDDPHTKCDHASIVLKGELAASALEQAGAIPTPNPFGAVKQCIFSQVIPYFDMADMLVIPASHGFLRGVIFDLWKYIFNPLDYKPKKPVERFRGTRQ